MVLTTLIRGGIYGFTSLSLRNMYLSCTNSHDFFFTHGTSASTGVCIAIRCGSGVNVVKLGFFLGHLLALDLEQPDGITYRVVGIYAPSDASKCSKFFAQLTQFLMSSTLLLRDFNSITNSCDCLSNNLDSTSNQLSTILKQWHFKEPPGSHLSSFTYHHPTLAARKSHIDLCYINFDSAWRGYSVFTPFTDHYCVGLS